MQESISNVAAGQAGMMVGFPIGIGNVKPFSGENRYHAVDFLATCKDSFIPGMSDEAKVKFVKRQLEGPAQTWANQNAGQFVNYNKFELMFLNKYWGQAKQLRLQNDFLNGPNYKVGNETMKEFCTRELSKLVHLDRPLGVLTEISTLKRRLPEELQWDLIHSPSDSVEDFLNFVENMDRALCYKPKLVEHKEDKIQNKEKTYGNNHGNGSKWGNNRNGHSENDKDWRNKGERIHGGGTNDNDRRQEPQRKRTEN